MLFEFLQIAKAFSTDFREFLRLRPESLWWLASNNISSGGAIFEESCDDCM